MTDSRFRASRSVRRNIRNGLIFISPWLVGFLCLVLYPVCASFYYSMTDYDIFTPPRFIALRNYSHLLTRDPLFLVAFKNTLLYAVFAIPLGIVMSLSIALLLNMKVKGLAIYRTIYYLPSLMPAVASSMLWLWILNPTHGLINSLLAGIGISGPGWLADPVWAKPSLIMMGVWGAGSMVIIYLAALQDVPKELYEAAELDGAGAHQRTLFVTLPMISPALFFNLIMGIIGSFQYFTQAYVMTQGGPVNSTLFYSLYVYQNAFQLYRMGYACAMAWLLFLLILVVTLSVFKSSGRWVYYGEK